jgi:hypothetical protein
MVTILHVPKNELPRIDCLWTFLSIDDDGNEGVCAASLMGPGTIIPLIAADEKRVESLMPVAQQLAAESGRIIRLVKFTSREVISQFGGQ